mgnify:CR=1 FL=1
MKYQKIAVVTILLASAFLFSGKKAKPAIDTPSPPNIIFILTDDQGWSSLSSPMVDGHPETASDFYETPNLDRFAKEGMRFTRGYAPASICSPSRRSIQFGQTPIRQGNESFITNYAPASVSALTIPQVLKKINGNYKAAHFGKWDFRAQILPEQLGYDLSSGDTRNGDGNLVQVKGDKWDEFYLTEDPKHIHSLTKSAINFISEQKQANNPFFVQISHYAAHVNMETKQATLDRFKNKPAGKKHNNPAWAGMLYDLDEGIGAILNKIEQLGIADNTYLFIMADNGATEFLPPVQNRLDHPSKFQEPMRNYPLRGGKWVLYEGGIRVPFMVKGPGIKPGSQCDIPVIGWDLLPTFAELAGQAITKNEHIDGGSLVEVLKKGNSGKVKRKTEDFYFHRYNNGYPHAAVISGNDKLVHFWKTGKNELYNLLDDIGELNDLAPTNPKTVKELEARLKKYINNNNPGLLTAYNAEEKK